MITVFKDTVFFYLLPYLDVSSMLSKFTEKTKKMEKIIE